MNDTASPSGFLHRPKDARYHARRAAVMSAVAIAHVVAFAWLLYSTMNSPADARPRNLVAMDISHVPEPDAPAKPTVVPPDPTVRLIALLPSAMRIEAAPPAAGNGAGNGCSVTDVVGAALAADPDATRELGALSPGARTEADAVMLWNGAWLGDPAQSDPTMSFLPAQSQISALRKVVSDTLAALPPDCREVQTTGPQFVPIAEPGRTTMLVIGSGVWRWSSLIDPPPAPGGALPGAQPASGSPG